MAPSIVLDGFPLAVRSAGIATYVSELTRGLAKAAPDWTFSLFRPRFPVGRADADRPPNVADRRSWLYPLVLGQPVGLVPSCIALETAIGPLDLFHGTNYLVPKRCRAPVVATVHDLTLLRHPELGTTQLVESVRRAVDRLDQVDRVIAVSRKTRDDLVELCGVGAERISVVYNGCSDRFRPRESSACREEIEGQLGIRGPFLTHVGTIEPRKNLSTLIRAFALLRERGHRDHTLLLVGERGWGAEPIDAIAAQHGVADSIHFAGRIDDRALPLVYGASDVVVYPSLYEGFGLPVIEAMASGTPVVVSDRGALPEIAGDAAVVASATDPAEIADAVDQILTHSALASDLRDRGIERSRNFSWHKAAAETLDVYRSILAAK